MRTEQLIWLNYAQILDHINSNMTGPIQWNCSLVSHSYRTLLLWFAFVTLLHVKVWIISSGAHKSVFCPQIRAFTDRCSSQFWPVRYRRASTKTAVAQQNNDRVISLNQILKSLFVNIQAESDRPLLCLLKSLHSIAGNIQAYRG